MDHRKIKSRRAERFVASLLASPVLGHITRAIRLVSLAQIPPKAELRIARIRYLKFRTPPLNENELKINERSK